MTPLSGRRGQQARKIGGPEIIRVAGGKSLAEALFDEADWYAERAINHGYYAYTHGDQLLAEAFAQIADECAAKARSVARPPSRRAR